MVLPAWLSWKAITATLSALPWRAIIVAISIGLAAASVVVYIRNSETAKAERDSLKTQNEALVAANIELETNYQTQLSVLQESIGKRLQREKNHAQAIKEIQSQPDSGCARNSLPIRAAVRLLRSE